jgi:2-phosphoglycerate kinase
VPVIIWINGGFGAGKTTLAQELHRRLPDALLYDPEHVGLMLRKWMPPSPPLPASQPGRSCFARTVSPRPS